MASQDIARNAAAALSEPASVAQTEISARLDRLPATRHIWKLVGLLSLGGFFEFYDLFFTGYVAPGLFRENILTPTTPGLFGTTGVAGFVAALFSGLFIGTMVFSFVADRFGRRIIFTTSLLVYTVCNVIMAFQHDAFGLYLWRFLAGVGIGVELVTIDTYISELVPKDLRGRAFAFNQVVQFASVPIVAALAYIFVPRDPLGFSGWRWVVLIGAVAAIAVWWIRRAVPESPRWLAARGRAEEADRITSGIEARVRAEYGQELPPLPPPPPPVLHGRFIDIFEDEYRSRTVMLVVFNIFQTVGFYGFANWVPTLLISQGIAVTQSLGYTFIIAIAAPFGPALGYLFADRIERKWQIVIAAGCIAAFGLLFANVRASALLILFGVLVTLSSNIMSFAFHAYQTELYPTRIRAVAVGFVYSFSRISAVFSAFIIAFFLRAFGASGVFVFIAGAMVVVMLVIGA
ncbi:MAG: MFS transporter, partial [Acetobacteraceae bacterium]|nr:MFS transporter [Acetobacteraceae bacterium]